MIPGVLGTVVATRRMKTEGTNPSGQTTDPESGAVTGYVIAVDTVGAGAGETVICVSGARPAWPGA
jgi:microcompartment protein CcmK/EutM